MCDTLSLISAEINKELRKHSFTMCTAESCTGGAIASAITSQPGSSEFFKGGIVAYSNEVKMTLLGVPSEILSDYGAVSRQTVVAMVQGVKKILNCNCAIATSGIAGPGGGSADKPVGTVWVAVSVGDRVKTELLQLSDEGRCNNICTSARKALSLLLNMVRER